MIEKIKHINLCLATYTELGELVQFIRKEHPNMDIWKKLTSYHGYLEVEDIKKMVLTGWHVKFCEDQEMKFFPDQTYPNIGNIDTHEKLIRLHSSLILEGIERDRTLFHELTHIFYKDKILFSNKPNEIIIEYLARRSRAIPSLLQCAILEFNLKPKIYDRSSYMAFKHLENLINSNSPDFENIILEKGIHI